MSVTATLWPIIFAAVLGQVLRAFTLYRAERGIKFGILELLSSSRTLTNTLHACFTIRVLSIWPLILVLAWSLSPVGGQSALRAMELKQNITTSALRFTNFPSNNLSVYGTTFFDGLSSQQSGINGWRNFVGTAFTTQDITLTHANGSISSKNFDLAIQKAGGIQEALRTIKRDIWRNVRVPFIHRLPGYSNTLDWIVVPSDAIADYSSLVGIPIRGFPSMESANTSFPVRSNYQTFHCSPWLNQTSWVETNNDSLALHNFMKASGTISTSPNIWFDRIKDNRLTVPNVFNVSLPQLTIVFMTRTNLTLCEVTTEYVESLVNCTRAAKDTELLCSISKMRRMTEVKDSSNLTALDFGMIMQVLFEIPFITASRHVAELSVLDRWLKDPTTALDIYRSGVPWYEDVPLPVFSDRLALVLNTHLLAALNQTIMVGNDDRSSIAWGTYWANTTATWSEFSGIAYHVNRTWAFLYLVSAIVLLLCAIANIALRCLILAPDFFGSTGALTRDSIFFVVPGPASSMATSDRCVLLKDEWVMIQDTMPDKEIGRIAFSNAKTLVPLQKNRKYC